MAKHRRSQDFLWGSTFLDQKSDDLFIVITFFSMVICVIYCHRLPFYLIFGVYLVNFTPFLPHFNKNCLEKFFRRPGGATAPPAHPGYAYVAKYFQMLVLLP